MECPHTLYIILPARKWWIVFLCRFVNHKSSLLLLLLLYYIVTTFVDFISTQSLKYSLPGFAHPWKQIFTF